MSDELASGSSELSAKDLRSSSACNLRERSLVCSLSFALILLLFLAAIFLSSCASHPQVGWTETEGEPAEGVDPAAVGASNFTVRKKIPTHDEGRRDFYFKHCDLDSVSTSKTSYFCNDF